MSSSTQPSTKVRLVRCPRCRQVLPELPDVSLYTCGGCHTILQAKSQRNETVDTNVHLQETDAVVNAEQHRVSEEEDEETGFNQDLTPPPSGESSPEKDIMGDHSQHEKSLSDEISSSPEINCVKRKESSRDVGKSLKHDEDKCILEQNTVRLDSGILKDYNSDQESRSSGEFNCHVQTRENTMKSRYLVPEDDVKGRNSPETSPTSAGQATEVNNDIKIHPIYSSLSKERDMKHTGDSFHAAQSPLNESIVTADFITSDGEYVGRATSIDTFESSPPVNDLSGKHEDMFKSPTMRSYYGYEGSVSSYDGTEDQIHNFQPSRRKFELPEMNRYDHASGSRTRLDEEGISQSRFSSSYSLEIHRNGKGKQLSYQHCPSFYSLDEPSYSEPDNMDLLRMVYEIKDQLNQMRFSNDMTNGRFRTVGDEKYTPLYDHRLVPEREMHSDLNHPRYHMRHSGHMQDCPGQCSCVHCFPQDWHYCDGVHSHASSSSTPQCTHQRQRYMSLSPEVSLLDHEMKRSSSREKFQAVKRHIRPIAGGAPLIACYHCSELLQLPADFLLFEKKYHRLRCNACRKVLKFSLTKGTNIVRYVPNVLTPPPSEADDYNGNTSKRNHVPISHSNPRPNAKRVSSSDDYEMASTSGSTKREASLVRSSFDASNEKMGSVIESIKDRKTKFTSKESSQNKDKSLAKAYESRMSKLKESAEVEVSPLHRLMGYSSLSQVLK